MKLPYSEQVCRFVDQHGIKILAGLGLTKAVETFVVQVITPWWFRAFMWLLVTALILAVAARSSEIDL